jgi:hypothetical protein
MYLGQEKIKSTKVEGDNTIVELESGTQTMPTDLFDAIKTEEAVEFHDFQTKKYQYIAQVLYTILIKYEIKEIELEGIMMFLKENITTTNYKLIFDQFEDKDLNPATTRPSQELSLKELYEKAYK